MENFGDLIGVQFSFNGISAVLNNHDGLGAVINGAFPVDL